MKNIIQHFGEGIKLALVVILFFFLGSEIDKEMDTSFMVVTIPSIAIVFSLYHLVKKIS